MTVAKYYPFNGKRGRLRLGLQPIKCSDWIQYENDFSEQISAKKKLINRHGKRVLDFMASSLPAQQELLQQVLDFLKKYRTDWFAIYDDQVVSLQDNTAYKISDFDTCPLELVSYLVAEDFCLLKEDNGDYKLVAASVCAPTWWDLSEKMGKPLAVIHAPIASLEEKIGRMIRHFLKNLKYEDFYQRSNWFLFTRPDLCVFPNAFNMHEELINVDVDNIEKHLFLRSERQTFKKLESTRHVVFGIKVYIAPISIVKEYTAIAEDLMIALHTMTEQQKQALGISFVEKPLESYLKNIVS